MDIPERSRRQIPFDFSITNPTSYNVCTDLILLSRSHLPCQAYGNSWSLSSNKCNVAHLKNCIHLRIHVRHTTFFTFMQKMISKLRLARYILILQVLVQIIVVFTEAGRSFIKSYSFIDLSIVSNTRFKTVESRINYTGQVSLHTTVNQCFWMVVLEFIGYYYCHYLNIHITNDRSKLEICFGTRGIKSIHCLYILINSIDML